MFVSELRLKLAAWECTSLLVGEYGKEDLIKRPEAAIADGIIFLSGMEERKYQKRFLRVLKMRGTDFLPGEHADEDYGGRHQCLPAAEPRC